MKVSVELSAADTERLQDEANQLSVSPEPLAHAANLPRPVDTRRAL